MAAAFSPLFEAGPTIRCTILGGDWFHIPTFFGGWIFPAQLSWMRSWIYIIWLVVFLKDDEASSRGSLLAPTGPSSPDQGADRLASFYQWSGSGPRTSQAGDPDSPAPPFPVAFTGTSRATLGSNWQRHGDFGLALQFLSSYEQGVCSALPVVWQALAGCHGTAALGIYRVAECTQIPQAAQVPEGEPSTATDSSWWESQRQDQVQWRGPRAPHVDSDGSALETGYRRQRTASVVQRGPQSSRASGGDQSIICDAEHAGSRGGSNCKGREGQWQDPHKEPALPNNTIGCSQEATARDPPRTSRTGGGLGRLPDLHRDLPGEGGPKISGAHDRLRREGGRGYDQAGRRKTGDPCPCGERASENRGGRFRRIGPGADDRHTHGTDGGCFQRRQPGYTGTKEAANHDGQPPQEDADPGRRDTPAKAERRQAARAVRASRQCSRCAPCLGHYPIANGPRGQPQEVCRREDSWPLSHATWHSVMQEWDYLAPYAAIQDAALWHKCAEALDDQEQAEDLASSQGSLTFLLRWYGEDDPQRSPMLGDFPRQGPPSNHHISFPTGEPMAPAASFGRGICDSEAPEEGGPRADAVHKLSETCTVLFPVLPAFEACTSTRLSDRRRLTRRVHFRSPLCELLEIPARHSASKPPVPKESPNPAAIFGPLPVFQPNIETEATAEPEAPAAAKPKQAARRPTALSYMLASQIELLPADLTGPLPDLPVQELSAVVAVPDAGAFSRYTVYEPRQNVFSRNAGPHWSPQDYLADAASSVHYVVRQARFHRRALSGHALPQVALTPVWARPDQQAVVVDLRPLDGEVCTVLATELSTDLQIAGAVTAQGCRTPIRLAERLLSGELAMRTAEGLTVRRLEAPPAHYDWLLFEPAERPALADEPLPAQPAEPPAAESDETSCFQVATFLAPAPAFPQPVDFVPASTAQPCCRQVGTTSEPTAGPDTAFHAEQIGRGTNCKASAMTALSRPHSRRWQVGTLSEPTVSDQAALCEAIPFPAKAFHHDHHRQVDNKSVPTDGAGRQTPPEPEADPPPILTPIGMADALEPTVCQKIKADDVEVVPAFLKDRRTFEQPVAHFLWGEMAQGQQGTYTVFDRIRHVTVEKCQFQADLESIVALTIARAPFAVRSVQLLTAPLEGFPKPQIVIAEIARPRGELPIPWDLRPIGFQVRTIRHMPQQETGEALRALQTQLPPHTDLEGLWRDGLVHVSDALGPVEPRLTEHLDEIQFFRILRVPIAALDGHVLRSPFYFGGTGARESTVTTTWAHATGTAHSPPALRVVVFRGEVSVSLDIRPPFRLFDEVLARLLAQHAHMRPFQPGSTLTLSRAFPPSLGYLQEVLFCISDDHTTPSFLWDARGIDGALTALTTAVTFMSSEFVVPQEWRDQGWTAAVNGVPVSHAQRTMVPGDFYQPYRGSRHPPCVPQGHVLAMVPALNPFVWPFPLSHFQRIFLPRLRDRRWRLGMHLATAPEHLVYGPEHGEIRIHVATASHLNHEEIVSYMQRLDHPPSWGSIAPTSLNLDNVATFVSKARNSGLHTVLTPAPFYTGHFFILLVSSRARVLRGVPLASDGALYPRQNFRQGDVLDPSHGFPRPLPDSSDLDDEAEAATQVIPATPSVAVPIADRTRPSTPQEDSPQPEATALLQIGARLLPHVQLQAHGDEGLCTVPEGCNTLVQGPEGTSPAAQGRRAIPTPFGRRLIPDPRATEQTKSGIGGPRHGESIPTPTGQVPAPAPQVRSRIPLCLADAVAPPPSGIGWAVTAEMVHQCLEDHGPHSLRNDYSCLDKDLREQTSNWESLPPWIPGQPCEELFLFTDGSYYPKAAQATWAYVVAARQGNHVGTVGFSAGKVTLQPNNNPSAFQGELEGLLHALATACRLSAPVVHVGGDCSAALDIGRGVASFDLSNKVARAIQGFVCWAQGQGMCFFWHKVEAHTGCAFNETADAIAKQVGRDGDSPLWHTPCPSFDSAVDEKLARTIMDDGAL